MQVLNGLYGWYLQKRFKVSGICTPVSEAEAKPGDLVFFEYTYEGPWITHVGIYVGEGWMVHAGNPIGYLEIMTSKYSDNFVGFGQLPAV